jgi:tight adherence protein B
MRRLGARFGLAALAAALTAGAASAANSPRIVPAGGSTYPKRSFVLSLPIPRQVSRSDVKVTESGRPVSGLSVVRQGTATSRSAVVIAIDESLTMRGKPIANALAAARQFARNARPDESIAVISFNSKIKVVQPFTTDASAVARSLSRTPRLGFGTKNYEALQQGLALIQAAKVPTGSIIVLTDGQSVGSKAKPSAVLHALARNHVRVFSLGLFSPAFQPAVLQRWASQTGGDYVEASTSSKIGPILAEFGRRLSNEYLLTYQSHSDFGSAVTVDVTVKGFPGVATSHYVAPKLHVAPAPPYKPTGFDKFIQSGSTEIGTIVLIGLLLGLAIVSAARTRSDPLVSRVGDFVSVQRSKREERESAGSFSAAAFLSRTRVTQGDRSLFERLGSALELAGVEAGPFQVVVLTLLVMIVVAILFYLVIGPVGFFLSLAVPFVVRAIIVRKVAGKRRAFAEQLPDNLDVLASSLRAGHSLVGALSVVAADAPEPSKSEFQRVLSEEQLGVLLEDAFQIAVRRMESDDLDQVALIARLQREMGANAAEVLDRVIETVRARMELRRLIRVLTAQGRMSRWLLTGLPIALALVLTVVSRGYMHPLFHRTVGVVLLILAGGMVSIGSWIIGKIVDIRIA